MVRRFISAILPGNLPSGVIADVISSLQQGSVLGMEEEGSLSRIRFRSEGADFGVGVLHVYRDGLMRDGYADVADGPALLVRIEAADGHTAIVERLVSRFGGHIRHDDRAAWQRVAASAPPPSDQQVFDAALLRSVAEVARIYGEYGFRVGNPFPIKTALDSAMRGLFPPPPEHGGGR